MFRRIIIKTVLVFLDVSADSPGEVLDGTAGLQEDLAQPPELELRLCSEGAARLTGGTQTKTNNVEMKMLFTIIFTRTF